MSADDIEKAMDGETDKRAAEEVWPPPLLTSDSLGSKKTLIHYFFGNLESDSESDPEAEL